MKDIRTVIQPYLSIVISVFNEEGNVLELHEQVTSVLRRIGKTYEIIVVDDGSTDTTFEKLQGIYQKDPHLIIIRFRRNFGQTAAIAAGFDCAMGDVIIPMDGDLQNDPKDIPKLLGKIEEGYDIVSGWRKKRKDPFFKKKIPSYFSNFIVSKLTGVKLHDYGCTLKAYKKDIVKNLNLYGEMHRFIPALASTMGAAITEVVVNHRSRRYGRTKYGVFRIVRGILDLATVKFLQTFSTRPIQIFGLWGLIVGVLGVGIALYLSILKIFYHVALADRPLLLLAILLMVVGVQFIAMGLLGELVTRTYYESQGKKIYVVKQICARGTSKVKKIPDSGCQEDGSNEV